jgi:hypothetical protein
METKQTVFIIVDERWFNMAGVNDLVGRGVKSNSSSGAHLIISGITDLSDHKGIWLGNVTTNILHAKDRSPVTMKVMIPWSYVLSVGVQEEEVGESMPIGFTTTGVAMTVADNQSGT